MTTWILTYELFIKKVITIIGLLALLAIYQLNAQDKSEKILIHNAWVKLLDKPDEIVKGVLYEVKDSSIIISDATKKSDYYANNFSVIEVNISDIKHIKIRRKGQPGSSILIGFLSPALIGTTAGFLEQDHLSTVAGVFSGLFVGMPIGAIIGSSRKEFIIDGRQTNYNSAKGGINNYAIIK